MLALIVPTPDETELLSEVIESERHRLRDVERDLWPLARVPRLPQRLRAILFARRSRAVEADVLGRIDQMRRAVKSASNSVALRQFIAVCVPIVNFVNYGFTACSTEARYSPPIAGFRFEGVPKLAREFKATSSGITLLHIILLHLGRHLQDAKDSGHAAEVSDLQIGLVGMKDASRKPRSPRGATLLSPRCSLPPPAAMRVRRATSPRLGVGEETENLNWRDAVSRAPQARSRRVKEKFTISEGFSALTHWFDRLKEELDDVRSAAKLTIADIEDHVAELFGEMTWVDREAKMNTEAYNSSCAASLLYLAASLPERRAKIQEEIENIKLTCERFNQYFGESLCPDPLALSATSHGLMGNLAEIVWELLECAVADLCLCRFGRALPTPEGLSLSGMEGKRALHSDSVIGVPLQVIDQAVP